MHIDSHNQASNQSAAPVKNANASQIHFKNHWRGFGSSRLSDSAEGINRLHGPFVSHGGAINKLGGNR
jgi:hypothetical protein